MKKHVKRDRIKNVEMMNSFVSFGPIRLNVIVYAIDGLLIDTGSIKLLHELKAFFHEVRPDKVMITHHHEDHTGCASYLQNKMKLPIYMHEQSIHLCEQKASYPLYRKLFWGKRPSFQAEIIPHRFSSKHNSWKTIETPGHAFDHLAYLNESTGQLFSGDLFVHPRTKVILEEESIPEIIQSIHNVLQYDFTEMFCNHAGYIQNGRQAMKEKLHYLESLQGEILTLYDKGYKVKEIQKQIFTKSYPITKLSLGEWDTKHIITSVIEAHKG